MNATATSLVRLAAIAVVVILAAAAGLMAGNVIRSDDANDPAGAGLPHMGGFDGARFETIEALRAGTPAFADPYRQIIEAAESAVDATEDAYEQYQRIEHDADADAQSAVEVTEDAFEQYQRIEHDADADSFSQTWGNLDERRPAAPAAEERDGSATAPTPR